MFYLYFFLSLLPVHDLIDLYMGRLVFIIVYIKYIYDHL